jgi:hypothetical protein
MDIVSADGSEPAPGARFEFRIEFERFEKRTGYWGTIEVGAREVAQFKCPDPPCYEGIIIRPEWDGELLWINAQSSSGLTARASFRIAARYSKA